MSDLINLLLKGGIFMIPLAVVAVLAIILIIERLLYLRQNRINGDEFHFHLKTALKDNQLNKAVVLAAKTSGLVGRVLEEGLRKIETGGGDIEAATEKAMINEMESMEKSRGWLNTLIYIAPLIGILGTVWGMIIAFMNIEQSASTDPKILAGGIYQALITTLAGLTIAVGATVAQEYIRRNCNRILHYLDLSIAEIREWIATGARTTASPTAAATAGEADREVVRG